MDFKLEDFTKEEIRKYQKISGIYALVYEENIFYVGQSVNLGKRLMSHINENALETTLQKIYREDGNCNRCKSLAMYNFINKNREKIKFCILSKTYELNEEEEKYIKLYKPKYNYIGIDVDY